MKKKNSGYQITANVVMMLVAVMVVLPFLLLFMGMTVRFAEDPKDLIRGKERA